MKLIKELGTVELVAVKTEYDSLGVKITIKGEEGVVSFILPAIDIGTLLIGLSDAIDRL